MNFKKTIVALSLVVAGSASANNIKPTPVAFEQLVSVNAQFPTVQVFKAEQASANKNYNKAVSHYIKAIELGISDAVWNLMQLIDAEKITGVALEDALKKVKSMARENLTLTLFLVNHYHGKMGEETTTFHWLNNSLRLGGDTVGELMADYVFKGIGGADKHYTKLEAATLLKHSADSGVASAALKLGSIFDDGKIIKRNLGQARHYYSLASDAGMIEANYQLAYFMEHGIGGEKNLKKAASLYQTLINTDKSKDAHFRLSSIYMYNDSVFPNARIDGVAHLIKAANLEHPDALYKVGIATYYGTDGFKLNIISAVEYLTQSAKLGNKLAAQRLIQIYQNGDREIKPNKELVKEFQRILTDAPKLK